MSEQIRQEDVIIKQKMEKIEELKKMGLEPFGRKYDKQDYISDIVANYKEEEETTVKTAGRIMAYRRQGAASFGQIEDITARMQYYVKKDEVGEENYEVYKKLAVGDFIGIEGKTFKTHSGEITIRVTKFELLSKNTRPLPEKFHGLTDVETRYRQRYIDLIVNDESRDKLRKRSF
jgi:lysyl-tRNA synthetase class 2